MIDSIYAGFRKIATRKGLFITGIAAVIIMVFLMGKPWGVAQLKDLSGVGVLDAEFGYSPQHTYDVLTAQGEKGRMMAVGILGLDLLFLIAYASFWTAFLIFIYQKWLPANNRWNIVTLVPLLMATADCLENILLLIITLNFPAHIGIVTSTASIITMIKWTLAGFNLVLTITGLIGMIIRNVSGKNRK
jgi:hypothetical protein